MAGALGAASSTFGPGRRLVEWGALGLVLAVLVLAFLRHAQDVQGRAELASVRSTLGSLRTAAVLRQIERARSGAGADVADAQRNPFDSALAPPRLYMGEQDARALPEGRSGWFYDPRCDCVGYLPTDTRWLTAPEGGALLLFRIRREGGLWRYEAVDRYGWQGEPLA